MNNKEWLEKEISKTENELNSLTQQALALQNSLNQAKMLIIQKQGSLQALKQVYTELYPRQAKTKQEKKV